MRPLLLKISKVGGWPASGLVMSNSQAPRSSERAARRVDKGLSREQLTCRGKLWPDCCRFFSLELHAEQLYTPGKGPPPGAELLLI